MYTSSNLSSISYPKIPTKNSELFCSQKNHNSMECSFVFQEGSRHDHQETSQQQEFHKFRASSLEIKLPEIKLMAPQQMNVEDECKTPTSLEHKITLICPPAPRKSKSVPLRKRKSTSRRRILLDLSSEVESMFPAAVLADFGNKIKKIVEVDLDLFYRERREKMKLLSSRERKNSKYKQEVSQREEFQNSKLDSDTESQPRVRSFKEVLVEASDSPQGHSNKPEIKAQKLGEVLKNS